MDKLGSALKYAFAWLLLAGYYYVIFVVHPRNDDNASAVLRGYDMVVNGNWLLEGWRVSPDTFLLCEIPLFGLLTKLLGYKGEILAIVPAVLWAGTVVASAWLSGLGRKAANHPWNLAFLGLYLALPILNFNPAIGMITDAPIHIGCTMYMLLAFGCLARYFEKASLRHLLSALVLCIASVVSDPMMTFVAVLPIAVTSLLWLALKGPHPRRQRQILIFTVLSILVSKLLVVAIARYGMHIDKANMRFVEFRELFTTLRVFLFGLLAFTGTSFFVKELTLVTMFFLTMNALRFPIFVLGWRAFRNFYQQVLAWVSARQAPEYLDTLLVVAILTNSAAVIFSNNVVDEGCLRYWIPGFLYSVIFISRTIPVTPLLKTWLKIGLVGSLLLGLASNEWRRFFHPRVVDLETQRLVESLEYRNLTDGFGSYWVTHIVTMDTRDKIRIRPLEGHADVRPYLWLTSYHDYELSSYRHPQRVFVCFNKNLHNWNIENLVKYFGPMVEQYEVETYRVLVFQRQDAVLQRLLREALSQWNAH